MKVRAAVRADLDQLNPGDLVLVACSGGADSVALALALLKEAEKFAVGVGVISIDHQLQSGSRERAEKLVAQLSEMGASPSEVISVDVGTEGGLEAAARAARYRALDDAAQRHRAAAIYLGHTASDQAESVLLGLARGSGARSLSGMARVNGIYRRPLLSLTREEVRSEVGDFEIWEDPHNSDSRFTRVRVRQLLEKMESEIGPGIAAALVRSASLLRDDADALDFFADDALAKLVSNNSLDLEALMLHPRAVRTRVVKRFLNDQGVSQPSAEQIDAVEALASRWKGQGPVALPGHFDAMRESGKLTLRNRP